MFRGNFSILLLIAVIVLSCEKIINEDIQDKESKLVLNAFINPDSTFCVSITSSISILTKDTVIYINNASVKIFENDILIDELRYNINSKLYTSDKKPSEGKTYRIDASANGFSNVTASIQIPVGVDIVSIDTFSKKRNPVFYSSEGIDESTNVFVIKPTINDPANEENFYLMYVEKIDTNNNRKDNFYSAEYLFTKSIIVEVVGLQLFYNYWKLQDDGVDISEDRYVSGCYFAFSDKTFNGKSKSFELEIEERKGYMYIDNVLTPINELDTGTFEIKLLSINKDYFTYINSESLYSEGGDPFTELVSVYSNIKGGFGIAFGSSSRFKTFTRTQKQ